MSFFSEIFQHPFMEAKKKLAMRSTPPKDVEIKDIFLVAVNLAAQLQHLFSISIQPAFIDLFSWINFHNSSRFLSCIQWIFGVFKLFEVVQNCIKRYYS